jgi:hypothetical protein
MLLPCISFAQKWNNEGVYAMPEINDKKVRLKPWDTIREAFTFTFDSFKYSYAVMRPNGRVAVSVDYEEYGTWKIYKDTTLSEPDKQTGKEHPFERMYAILDDGRIYGYFEPVNAVDSNFSAGSNTPLSFIRNNKVFNYSRKIGRPLQTSPR